MHLNRALPAVTLVLLAACGQPATPSSGANSPRLDALNVRAGNHQIAAHAGDREAKPGGWDENEWENSIQAINSAKNKGARWIEVDVQLNRHPSAITSTTPYGILYLHHNRECQVITTSGALTSTKYNIGTDEPRLVDRCAERLNNVLNSVNLTGRWMFEMKSDTGYRNELPRALYDLLQRRGQRTTEWVTSLDEGTLLTLRDLADFGGVRMNLTRVYDGLPFSAPSNRDIDFYYDAGVRGISVNVNNWNQDVVNYAKSRGMTTMGWHWNLTSPVDGNQKAVDLDLDVMVTDSISDLQRRNWR